MTRFKASFIHLVISALMASILLSLMLGLWYPGNYFRLMGGGELIFLMVGVDVCLGPLLTLVVFKSGKKTLKFDLLVICILQLIALTYGAYVMFSARPVFAVFAKDQFRVVSANELDPKDIDASSSPQWKSLPLSGPRVVVAIPPENIAERDALLFSAINGKDWEKLPKLYQAYDKHTSLILSKSNTIQSLREFNKNHEASIDSWFKNKNETDYVYIPVKSRYAEMAMILDAKTGNIQQILDVKPW